MTKTTKQKANSATLKHVADTYRIAGLLLVAEADACNDDILNCVDRLNATSATFTSAQEAMAEIELATGFTRSHAYAHDAERHVPPHVLSALRECEQALSTARADRDRAHKALVNVTTLALSDPLVRQYLAKEVRAAGDEAIAALNRASLAYNRSSALRRTAALSRDNRDWLRYAYQENRNVAPTFDEHHVSFVASELHLAGLRLAQFSGLSEVD